MVQFIENKVLDAPEKIDRKQDNLHSLVDSGFSFRSPNKPQDRHYLFVPLAGV